MSYQGDYKSGATIDFTFTTRNAAGEPTALAGSPALAVYKANSVTQTTTGITLTVDFDSITGLNHVRIAATDAFYATANDFAVVLTAGTVDGVSVAGEGVATFSIQNRSSLDAAAIREALGMSSANLDTQLFNIGIAATTRTWRPVDRVYLGNFAAGSMVNFHFTTRNKSGVLANLSSATLKAYPHNFTAFETTNGITLTTGFDGVTGLNHVQIDMASYQVTYNNLDWSLVLTAGNIGGDSVVGEVVGHFSVTNRYMRGTDSVSVPTTSQNATALLDLADGIETGKTLRQTMRAMAAVLAGEIADAGESAETYKAIGNPGTTRVTATVDEDGNRTGMTLNL